MESFKELYSLEDPSFIPLSSHGLFPNLTEDQLVALEARISLEEVKQALFEMKPLKSPGKDGFHALFYQTQWNILGPSILRFI